MKNHFIKLIFILFGCFIYTSCITIGLSKNAEPAKNLNYLPPENPFAEMKSKTGDKSWISNKTGNTISYISDCSANNDPSLEQLENDALSGIEKLEVKESSYKDFNQRTSKQTTASGNVDGVPIVIKVISFKKNNCSYNLVYGGKSQHFEEEKSIFNHFVEGFKAP
jgi:hypothetical protein